MADMRLARSLSMLALACGVAAAVAAAPAPALAQQVIVTPAGQKICQTIRACDFRRSAEVRGCISAFACRTCRFDPVCTTIGGKRVCEHRARCGWRGA